MAGGIVKILFVMLHPGFIRNYESVLRLLDERGHRVHVAFEMGRKKLGESTLMDRLRMEAPNVTFGEAPVLPSRLLVNFARVTRIVRDYLRYLEPTYEEAISLRRRVQETIPTSFRRVVAVMGGHTRLGRRMLEKVLRRIELTLPPAREVSAFVHAQAPDAVIVTPLVDFGSDQVDYLKAARTLGVPSALCVASWDNLTNKGLMRVVPDKVIVWNEAQKAEAVALHGAPAGRVVVTGAQLFDHWFDWSPHRSRAEFAAQVGVDPERPFVLYLGSSYFIAPDEAHAAERWMRAVRASADPILASAGILVRPHPTNVQQWLAFDFSQIENASLWPRVPVSPFTQEFKNDFYDSMYYSAAICGVNTSALIEAAIVGRAVCTHLAPEFAHSQLGTLHFRHLLHEHGGPVQIATTLDDHLAQLAAAIRDAGREDSSRRAFVKSFVRPRGLDVAATPVVTSAIEDLPSLEIRTAPRSAWSIAACALLIAPAWFVSTLWQPGRKLIETRPVPVWMYVMRPLVFVVVLALTAFLALRESADGVRDGSRRTRRTLAHGVHAARGWVRRRVRPQEIPKAVRRAARQSGKKVRSNWRRAVEGARSRVRLVWR